MHSRTKRRALQLSACLSVFAFAPDAAAQLGPEETEPLHTGPHEENALPDEEVKPENSAKVQHEDPNRWEFGGVPAVSATSQLGFIFGGLLSVAKLEEGVSPYRSRLQLLGVASVKKNPEGGTGFPLKNVKLVYDHLGLADGKLRLISTASYLGIETAGYFGIGNDVGTSVPADYVGPEGRFFQVERQQVETILQGRYRLPRNFYFAFGIAYLWLATEPYQDSRFDRDLLANMSKSDPLLRGADTHSALTGMIGALYDTRDNEVDPSNGYFLELSLRSGVGFAATPSVAYGSMYVNLRGFWSLVEQYLVLAARAAFDYGFGNTPYYEMNTLGGDTRFVGPAGPEGNRGLLPGRQFGKVKLLGDLELRSMFWRFSIKKTRFGLGAAAFADTSRVWSEFPKNEARDGTGLALLTSVGGGIRFLWGSAFMLRLDVASGIHAGTGGDNSLQFYFVANHAF